MSGIAVTPEGREGVWLADRASLKAWIEAQHFECIHNFGDTRTGIILGADHDVASVLKDIDKAERVAILTGASQRGNMNHALALIAPPEGRLPERLEMYDIGPIDESVLDLSA